MITSNQAGEYGGRVLQLTLANGGQVFLYDEDLPADAIEAALAAEQGIIDGTIKSSLNRATNILTQTSEVFKTSEVF